MSKRTEAEAMIKEFQERYYNQRAEGRDLAVVYAGLGDKEQAFALLVKAYKDRSSYLAILRLVPAFHSAQSDPRWNDLLRRVGL